MADLAEKLGEEQQQFIRAQWLDAEDAERFRYMDPRVEAQLQVSPLRLLCFKGRYDSCHCMMY